MLMAERWAHPVLPGPRTPPKLPRSIERPSGTDCYIANMRDYNFHRDGGGVGNRKGRGYRDHSRRQRSASSGSSTVSSSSGKGRANNLNNSKHYLSKRELANHYGKQDFHMNQDLHTAQVTVENIKTVKQRDSNHSATSRSSARTRRIGIEQQNGESQGGLARWVDSVNANNSVQPNNMRQTNQSQQNQRTVPDMDAQSVNSSPSAVVAKNGNVTTNNHDQWEVSSVSSRSSGLTTISAAEKTKLTSQYGLSPRIPKGHTPATEHLPSLSNGRQSTTAPTGDFLSPRGSISSTSRMSNGGVGESDTRPTTVPNITTTETILEIAMRQVDDTHRVEEQINFAQTKKKDFNSKSSSEFKQVLDAIKDDDDDVIKGIPRLPRPVRKLSRNWTSLRSKLRTTVSTQRGGPTGPGGRRMSDAVPTINEEKESDEQDKTRKGKKKVEAMSRPLGKGWRFVKTNMKTIIQMADDGKIQPGPHFRKPVHNPFKSLRDIIMGKEFQMMVRRKSSFIENGVFQFEAAKNDLYARYKAPVGANNTNNSTVQRNMSRRLSTQQGI